MNKLLATCKVYAAATAILIAWWWLAFGWSSGDKTIQNSSSIATKESSLTPLASLPIAYVQRAQLVEVLAGNLSMIPELVTAWDIDAQLLQSAGLPNISRLNPEELFRLHYTYRIYKKGYTPAQTPHSIVDDIGREIKLEKSYTRFLPQTHVAASFLLALVPPDQIVALPRQLREDVELYPKALTSPISLDIDRYNGERLYRAAPEIAFVAHYSNPATIDALTRQDIQLYTMRNPDSLEDIIFELKQIGTIASKPAEADLLASFIKAAMFAIDNQLILNNATKNTSNHILFVNYHLTYSIPTMKTVNGQLIARMGEKDSSLSYAAEIKPSHDWVTPISKEEIVNLNPDCLVIIAENPELVKSEITKDKSFNSISAVKNHKISVLKESIQHSPSQYIVLAYYDLVETLINMP